MGSLLILIVNVLILLIFVRAILSWFPDFRYRYREVYNTIARLTDPILIPCQRLLPTRNMGGLDLSPVLAFFLLTLLKTLIARVVPF